MPKKTHTSVIADAAITPFNPSHTRDRLVPVNFITSIPYIVVHECSRVTTQPTVMVSAPS